MGEFKCGAAKRCITPPAELIPDLRALMDQRLGAVLEDLYVRVIALESDGKRALFVCFELDKVPQEKRYYELLEKAVGVPEENITLTAVHTHSAPISGYRPFEGPNFIDRKPAEVQKATHAFEDFVAGQLEEAAKEAVESLQPAKMGIAAGESFVNIDRKQWYEYTDENGMRRRILALGRNAASPVDHTLTILRFEDLTGKTIAVLVHYPCHCCIMHTNPCGGGGMLGIGPDLGGAVSAMMEKDDPGAVVLWCSGAAGDVNPIMQNEIYYPDPETGRPVTAKMPGGDCLHLLTLLSANHYADIRRTMRGMRCTQTDVPVGGTVEWSRTQGLFEEYEIRLHMLRIGSVYFLGGSGEFYGQYARILRSILPEKHALIVNHEASLAANSGYILDTYTESAPEMDLPGPRHLNMRAGLVEKDFAEHALHMYETLR